ncbi:speckle targeted PIP5K1A-regulated poly(A) polymerase-like [Helicoverpa zea]|uniref:speckle targeted PIP5K1A-regulated poly(A) polymerase-like n=1 Tax=Helicoverpa zea TaxID=7113 RepID=UPI001F5A3D46|nr:speckle targeted PIP5K1A-regulated poly(A) polymerase-like [Helicoverpa zea]
MYTLLGFVSAAVLVVARSELCLQGGFESQLQQVLDAYMLRPQLESCIITTVADDVLRTLSPRWQGIEMIPYGSLVTGLGTHLSDLDFSVTMPNYNSSRDAEWDMLHEINELVMQQPDLYSEINYSTKAVFARYSFNHSTTHRKVDLVFRLGDNGVQNSKVIKYYFHLDDRFLPLGVLLKLAFEIHDLIGPGVLKNYALYLLVIFFLQQKNMAPAGFELQRDAESYYVGEWDTGFDELPYSINNTESVLQLLGGFFQYYSQFDFQSYVVSTFAGRPILKNDFMSIDTFPEEFTIYKNNSKLDLQLKIKNTLSPNAKICILDTYVHELITVEDTERIKTFLKSAAAWFEDLPADRFLSAILSKQQDSDTQSSSEQNCIDIPDSGDTATLRLTCSK